MLVLTTCSVREKARQKVHSAIGRMKRLKTGAVQRGPVIVVAGCVAQQDGRAILDDAPHVDLVVGPDHLYVTVQEAESDIWVADVEVKR